MLGLVDITIIWANKLTKNIYTLPKNESDYVLCTGP